MKKISKILLSILVIIGLTGCVKYNVSMDVKRNKSFELELIYAMDLEVLNAVSNTTAEISESKEEDNSSSEESTINKEDYNWLAEKGYKVETYKEKNSKSNYVGVKISKNFKSIDEVTKEEDKVIDFNNLFDDKDNFDDSQFFSKTGNTYKANFIFDMSDSDAENTTSKDSEEDLNSLALASMLDLKYSVTLPNKPVTHNASIVSEDGLTLTWLLENNKKNEIKFSFEIDENGTPVMSKDSAQPTTGVSNMKFYIIIGALAIIVIALVIILTRKKETGNTINTSNAIVGEIIPENAEETQALEPKEISVEEAIDETIDEESK